MRNLVVTGLLLLVLSHTDALYSLSPKETDEKQRGVSWVAGSRVVTAEDFQPLLQDHVTWIVQTPFGWQRDYNAPTLNLVTDGRIYWGERDTGLEVTTKLASAAGIQTLLKPHIWLRRSGGKWRGEIAMENEADWQRWFASYRTFILHYARFAETNGIAALAVGTELHTAAVTREQDWRDLIAEIRRVYHGKLTYSANWYKEFEEIQFWDALDFVGIQGYFPLSEDENPTVKELIEGWQPYLAAIERISLRFQKPVLFTEIGYRSSSDAAHEPWQWPGRHVYAVDDRDLQTQANCYEAFFRVFWHQPWFAGAYFWKWFPGLKRTATRLERDFTPQNKPAEQVMAKWFAKTLP